MKKIQIVLMAMLCLTGYADTLKEVDSLLNVYGQSKGQARTEAGRQLLAIYAKNSVFFNDPPTIANGLDDEVQDLTVWFGTERFYTTNAYYNEALTYIERAMPLSSTLQLPDASTPQQDIHATLLCDKSYCLFKTSSYTQAIEAGQEAIRLSVETDNLMQLSRAYLYISLVNHALRKYDEAKALVVKAIETNEKLGLNVQTHNALGIACEIFCSAMEIDKAIDYGKQAVEAARAIGYQPGVANHLTQLSYAYDRKGDYALGLQMADEAIAMVKAMEPLDRNQLAICLEYKSWNLIDIGRPREAAEALYEAIRLEEEVGNTHAVWYDYRTLSEALESFDPHGSINALKRYTRMGDSIHSEELKELMSKANAEFHNDELQEENAESRRMNRIIIWTTVCVVLLLALAIASLLYAFRQKNRMASALKRLTEARENFFTNVTHELRTPLTVILGLGRELQKNTPSDCEDIKDAGATIERQGEQLLTLVNQMLDISKVKSALGEQPSTTGDLTAYVVMVVERYQELARQKGVTLDFTADKEGIETTFVADYVEKVVGNLLSNAIKFTPEGGSVKVNLRRSNDHEAVSLVVSDTGMGISSEHLPHIFEPFYQANNTPEMGSGIGLALVKQIVDTLGGTISVESEEGKGTVMRLLLPVSTIHDSQSSQNSQKPQKSQKSQPESSPTLLIVEDNADVARLMGRQLGDRYELYYAADGQEGIEKARELIPDLIITDLMMPVTDGLQLCTAIRADEVTNHIPIIVVTAKATESDRIKGLAAGADAYLYKPFNADELNLRVEKLLQQRELLRRKFELSAIEDKTAKAKADDSKTPLSDTLEEGERLPFTDPSVNFVAKAREAVLLLLQRGDNDVDHLAEQLCVSPYQLRSKLASVTGMTTKRFIISVQLDYAKQMLMDYPERTIVDIAERCGFYDKSHFTRHFREAFGQTPSEYVKSKGNGGGSPKE